MSRHAITPHDPSLDVTVGWDPPLQTFFAQVQRRRSGRVLLWIGGVSNEAADPQDLAAPLTPYAELSPEMAETLRTDRAKAPAPSPLQHEVRARLMRP